MNFEFPAFRLLISPLKSNLIIYFSCYVFSNKLWTILGNFRDLSNTRSYRSQQKYKWECNIISEGTERFPLKCSSQSTSLIALVHIHFDSFLLISLRELKIFFSLSLMNGIENYDFGTLSALPQNWVCRRYTKSFKPTANSTSPQGHWLIMKTRSSTHFCNGRSLISNPSALNIMKSMVGTVPMPNEISKWIFTFTLAN